MFKAVQIDRYFILNLAPCDASFLCLEWFKNENLLTKTIVMLFSPLHAGSKDKNKMSEMLIFFLFVLHVVCLFFFTVSRTLSYLPHVKDTFTNINNRQVIITKRKYLYMHSLFKTQRKKKQNLRSNLLGTRAGCSHDLFSGEEKRRFFFFFLENQVPEEQANEFKILLTP